MCSAKGSENGIIDAEAIAEAVTKENLRFLQIKTEEHLAVQAMHGVGDGLMQRRTAPINQLAQERFSVRTVIERR